MALRLWEWVVGKLLASEVLPQRATGCLPGQIMVPMKAEEEQENLEACDMVEAGQC